MIKISASLNPTTDFGPVSRFIVSTNRELFMTKSDFDRNANRTNSSHRIRQPYHEMMRPCRINRNGSISFDGIIIPEGGPKIPAYLTCRLNDARHERDNFTKDTPEKHSIALPS